MNKKICGKSEGARRASPDEWYLVVLLDKNQLFPGPDQHVQRKPEEEAIVILRERILSKHSYEKPVFMIIFSQSRPYLVTLRQALPSFDEALPYDVLILRRSIGIVVEDVGHVLVHVRQQRAELRPQKLVEQLLDAHAESRLELGYDARERRDARAHRFDLFCWERLGYHGRGEQVFYEAIHVRCGHV